MAVTTWNTAPNYDEWGSDSYWSCADWVQWHKLLKEKFGKDLKVKKFEAAQSWLKRKLSSQLPGSYSEVINELEVRSIWYKYGL